MKPEEGPVSKLPVECWERCLDFASKSPRATHREALASRLISSRDNEAYEECVFYREVTQEMHHLLSPHYVRGRFHAMLDIQELVTLFPAGSLDLSDSQSPDFLHRFHIRNGTHLVRGVDWDSRTAFMSIWLQNVVTPTNSLLFICHFNEDGLERVTAHLSNSRDWEISTVDVPMNMENLQKLLVDQHGEFIPWEREYMDLKFSGTCHWSMEGIAKRRRRRSALVTKYGIPACCCCAVVSLALYLLYVIIKTQMQN